MYAIQAIKLSYDLYLPFDETNSDKRCWMITVLDMILQYRVFRKYNMHACYYSTSKIYYYLYFNPSPTKDIKKIPKGSTAKSKNG